MKRAGLGSAAAWAAVARAQQSNRIRRVGVLMNLSESDPEEQARAVLLRETLEKLGWMVGRNLAIEYRWAMGDRERIRAAATDLVRAVPDVILASGGPSLASLQQATSTQTAASPP
jgi:putative tryptophan/tyrosine transport system substrate-binding protein